MTVRDEEARQDTAVGVETALEAAWRRHIDRAVSRSWVYWGMNRAVTSDYIPQLLIYLAEHDYSSRYAYAMARVTGHDYSNLIRRMERWEKMGIVRSEVEQVEVRPRKFYTLTKAGQRLAKAAADSE